MLEHYDSNLILDYIEGELPAAEKAGFEQLLVQDRELRLLVDQMMEDRRLLRKLPLESAPGEVLDRVQQRLERNMLLDIAPAQAGDMAVVRRFRIGRLAAYGGMAAMVLISALFMYRTLAPWNGRGRQLDRFAFAPESDVLTRAEPAPPPAGAERGAAPRESVAAAQDHAAATPAELSPATLPDSPDSPASRLALDAGQDAGVAGREVALGEQAHFFAMLEPAAGSDDAAVAYAGEKRGNVAANAPLRRLGMARNDVSFAPQQIKVETTDLESTEADLRAWAIDNNAGVYHKQVVASTNEGESLARRAVDRAGLAASEPALDEQNDFAWKMHEGKAQGPSTQQVVVVVRSEQLPQLLENLRASAIGNRVSMVNEAGDEELAAPAPTTGSVAESIAPTVAAAEAPVAMDPIDRLADRARDASPSESRTHLTLAWANERRESAGSLDLDLPWGLLMAPQLPLSPRAPVSGDAMGERSIVVQIERRPSAVAPAAAAPAPGEPPQPPPAAPAPPAP